ncbi:MAG: HlyD family efflux transporter periplasmic adaptor subunit [Sulfuricella sp.]|nr:HlyD family efflux transporter periplasmic adaptor subunit [Sulfuricella sp.]
MKAKIAILLVFASLLGAALVFWMRHSGQPAPTTLTLQGNVDIRQVELAFNASGRIAALLAREGEEVRAGQVLGRLDTQRLSLALEQAEAQATAQRHVLARYQAGSRPEEIRQARAQRDAARVAVSDAEHFQRRQEALAARGFISPQQADSARFAFEKARAQLQAAEETLRLAEIGPRQEDIASARATLAAQSAAADLLRHDIGEGELRAPVDGIIENRILETGDMASPQKPVLTLALTDQPRVRVWLPEAWLGRVPLGALATVRSDSHPDQPLRAWVGYVSPSAEFTPKSVETVEIRTSLVYQARVMVCGGEGRLRLGMPVTVTIPLDQALPQPGGDPCREGR